MDYFQHLLMRSIIWVAVIMLAVLESGCNGCLEKERIALLQLKHSINIPNRIDSLPSWEEDDNMDCCQWERVECNSITRRVVKLELYGVRDWRSMDEYWHLNASILLPFESLRSLNLSENLLRSFVGNEEPGPRQRRFFPLSPDPKNNDGRKISGAIVVVVALISVEIASQSTMEDRVTSFVNRVSEFRTCKDRGGDDKREFARPSNGDETTTVAISAVRSAKIKLLLCYCVRCRRSRRRGGGLLGRGGGSKAVREGERRTARRRRVLWSTRTPRKEEFGVRELWLPGGGVGGSEPLE
ncbi:hypothetical protein RHSIM_Rhsim01G0054100 [Rhododendron simsii]|uniref:Leucine-rich repeat-containing N-terminal plant-type domain-containing protein n=1 Tax=Rhododendron simsii TaxID=118357 RepID=A0A834HGY4_RHOSS|nr:hypothetical protein RHSIM_Rhsim01G0054100 [Rhododendron simsii]